MQIHVVYTIPLLASYEHQQRCRKKRSKGRLDNLWNFSLIPVISREVLECTTQGLSLVTTNAQLNIQDWFFIRH